MREEIFKQEVEKEKDEEKGKFVERRRCHYERKKLMNKSNGGEPFVAEFDTF